MPGMEANHQYTDQNGGSKPRGYLHWAHHREPQAHVADHPTSRQAMGVDGHAAADGHLENHLGSMEMLRPLAVKDSHLHHTDPAHEINVFAPLSKGPGGAPILGDLFSPPDIYDNFVAQGVKKAHASWMPAMVLGFMAGCYIGLGALLADTVGGNIPGVKATNLGLQKFVFGFIGLPFGLLMVVITGADLYTSTVGCCFAAFVARKISFFDWLRASFSAWLTNLAGSLVLVGLVYAGQTHEHDAGTMAVARVKTSHPFGVVFCRGILCNWLVCMAVVQATSANTFAGKFFAVLFPIGAFVTMGFDHSVANMFLVPMGMAAGAHDVTVTDFIVKSLIPATLGNAVGGAFFVATVLGLAYDKIPGLNLAENVCWGRDTTLPSARREASRRK